MIFGGHIICESGFVNKSIMKRLLTFAFFIAISFQVSGETHDLLRRNLKNHIQYLSSDALQGRKTGTKGEKMAAEYLYDALEANGVIMLTDRNGQDFTIMSGNDSIHSRNIVGIIEGCDSLLRDEYIVVGAHFDHLGTHTLMVDGNPVMQIFAGADDNASGVAMLIELSRMVSETGLNFPFDYFCRFRCQRARHGRFLVLCKQSFSRDRQCQSNGQSGYARAW